MYIDLRSLDVLCYTFIFIMIMQLHSKMTNRRVVLLIVCIWAVAIIMGLVPSIGWNCECQLSHCSIIAPLYSRR